MGKSNISYLDWVFNVWTGCSGEDCLAHCYAMDSTHTFPAIHGKGIPFRHGVFHLDRLIEPSHLRQPWAWAIFHGKPVENRDWYHPHRGSLLIHASKTFEDDAVIWIFEEFGLRIPDKLPLGAFVGKVQMVGCVKQHPSPWFFGPYGHVYENPVEFENPIQWRGMPGIFDVPDEIANTAMNRTA